MGRDRLGSAEKKFRRDSRNRDREGGLLGLRDTCWGRMTASSGKAGRHSRNAFHHGCDGVIQPGSAYSGRFPALMVECWRYKGGTYSAKRICPWQVPLLPLPGDPVPGLRRLQEARWYAVLRTCTSPVLPNAAACVCEGV